MVLLTFASQPDIHLPPHVTDATQSVPRYGNAAPTPEPAATITSSPALALWTHVLPPQVALVKNQLATTTTSTRPVTHLNHARLHNTLHNIFPSPLGSLALPAYNEHTLYRRKQPSTTTSPQPL